MDYALLSMQIIDHLREWEEDLAEDIAAELGVPMPLVSRRLAFLGARGWVRKDDVLNSSFWKLQPGALHMLEEGMTPPSPYRPKPSQSAQVAIAAARSSESDVFGHLAPNAFAVLCR